MKIMPVMTVNAVSGKHKPQSEVNFDGKIKIPSKLPAKGWLMGGVAAVLFSLGVTTGCSMKDNNITGLDKTNETELYTHALTRTQVPVFNNHPVGQRFLDWYGENHLGINIPRNSQIKGFCYYSTLDSKFHEYLLIQADEDNFKLIEKRYSTPEGIANYILHNYNISGEGLIDNMSASCMQGYDPYNPESTWSPPIQYLENIQNTTLNRSGSQGNLLHSLSSLSPNALLYTSVGGVNFEYQNFRIIKKKDGPIPHNDTIPMER